MNQIVPKPTGRTAATVASTIIVPTAIAGAGEHAARRFLEFFAATIRNKNTRLAYYRACCSFFAWLEQRRIAELVDIETLHVAAYVEALQETAAKPTVKQHLAAVRMLFDWLVVGHVLAVNPAHAVRGPKYVIKRGKTPVLSEEQARRLIESIDTSTVVGLRDRALIGVMTYAFARIGAVVAMRVEDYYPNGKRWWVRLHEKGGKRHEMPAHHKLEAFIDEYLAAAGIRNDGDLGQSPACLTGSVPNAEGFLDRGDLLLDCSELGGQALQRLACEVGQTGVGIILDPFDELPGARQALCRDDAEF